MAQSSVSNLRQRGGSCFIISWQTKKTGTSSSTIRQNLPISRSNTSLSDLLMLCFYLLGNQSCLILVDLLYTLALVMWTSPRRKTTTKPSNSRARNSTAENWISILQTNPVEVELAVVIEVEAGVVVAGVDSAHLIGNKTHRQTRCLWRICRSAPPRIHCMSILMVLPRSGLWQIERVVNLAGKLGYFFQVSSIS